MKYVCGTCGWIYDEFVGNEDLDIEAETRFEELPEDFVCPFCFTDKVEFFEIEE